MYKTLLVAVVCLMVVGGVCQAKSLFSATDYVGVTSADTLGEGNVTLGINSIGRNFSYGANDDGWQVTAGVLDNLQLSINGDLDNDCLNANNISLGLKFNVAPASEKTMWLKPSVFLYGMETGETAIPGLVVDYDNPKVNYSFSGSCWRQFDETQWGFAGSYNICPWASAVAEYGSVDGAWFGGLFSYKNASAIVSKSASGNGWFTTVGYNFNAW